MKPRYSGEKSIRFWKRINAIANRAHKIALYRKAVQLQGLEHEALDELREAEKARSK